MIFSVSTGHPSPGSELGEGQVRCPVCEAHLQAADILIGVVALKKKLVYRSHYATY